MGATPFPAPSTRTRRSASTDGIAAMGHKMLPLFTLLGANELVALLKELEDSRGQVFSEKIKEKSFSALAQIEDVVAQVEE